ncbi:RNA-binding protein [Candidatus Bathyarchaeota archaeon]|nr:RNA-binding protein [Candidatus Bathyarchaeota archaeon]MBS7630734.1 RNA-binding protein [Candidatus Bathyarchaeota archaeon]
MTPETSKIKKKKPLRQREVKALKEVSTIIDSMFKSVEVIELESGNQIYFLDGTAELLRIEGTLYPTLKSRCIINLPSVVIDMGAVPYICNGADVMAPGIVEVTKDFSVGDLVVIKDERHGKPLAIGKALQGSGEVRKAKRGKVIQNLHYVGDCFWKVYTE